MTPTLIAKDDGLYVELTDRTGRLALLKLESRAPIAGAVIEDTWRTLREERDATRRP